LGTTLDLRSDPVTVLKGTLGAAVQDTLSYQYYRGFR
jgi:hypothetical protein